MRRTPINNIIIIIILYDAARILYYIFKVHFYKSALSTVNTRLLYYYIILSADLCIRYIYILYNNIYAYCFIICRHGVYEGVITGRKTHFPPGIKHVLYIIIIYFCKTFQTYKRENSK